ncbi:MAG: DEAD/DEAH box helicase [Deltaproteobacteria bacterium]|nr:DEAD/DEAH box helicase [Deltaproteobacteria bacterium]
MAIAHHIMMKKAKKTKGKISRHDEQPLKNEARASIKNFEPEALFNRLEFHRHALALMPDPDDKNPGVAVFIKEDVKGPGKRFCSCFLSKRKTCPHILQLMEAHRMLEKRLNKTPIYEDFKKSIWYQIASILVEGHLAPLTGIQAKTLSKNDGSVTIIEGPNGEEWLRYFSNSSDLSRFIERCLQIPSHQEDLVPQRYMVLSKLASYTMNENEWRMAERGFKTRRQALEESFWFRTAYHGYREFGTKDCSFHPTIEEVSGSFMVMCKDSTEKSIFRINVPRSVVKRLIISLNSSLPNQNQMPIYPIPLKSIFNITLNTELDLEIRPLARMIQERGEDKFYQREDLERFRYDDLVYIPELGLMAGLERPGQERRFKAPVKMVLKRSQVPIFLEEFGDELKNEFNEIDPSVGALRIIKQFDRIKISPTALDRGWCWLSLEYGFGNTWLSLNQILHARREGHRYIGTPDGWVDCRSLDLPEITGVVEDVGLSKESEDLRLSRMDLFRFRATSRKPLDISGGDGVGNGLKRMLELKASRPLPKLKGMKSTLRPYQIIGVEWAWFLYENGFGGLLCDDMGLGKTHQIMAFVLALQQLAETKDPFLVVCPTTVLSHWKEKIRMHAPSLKAAVYYGGDRELGKMLEHANILITSYGILLRDIDRLKDFFFTLAAFDEVQHIKNPETKAYQAALMIQAKMKIGLTGTPIENRLEELKALMDLMLPGYLGTDQYFQTRYSEPIQDMKDKASSEELTRLISPFTLRRLKKSVLDELPDKIEDIMSCTLSDDQVKLYRDAISSRGGSLLESLQKQKEPVPYIHIFALLNLLKQICGHPALLEETVDDFEKYQSGKWELFKELLVDGMGSDQKVVVYSQYLGMIKIMEMFLKQLGVGFVTLTGSSRKRGEIIHRFNNDPDCRVYVGSLKAGGVGVDLIAASIVIHYDRWWNAAKEDQATDRVHRIGQTRGVQVFKMVTKGTLEEKISAIIKKKRNLMDSIVKEDDPGVLKTFSRDELIDLLRF